MYGNNGNAFPRATAENEQYFTAPPPLMVPVHHHHHLPLLPDHLAAEAAMSMELVESLQRETLALEAAASSSACSSYSSPSSLAGGQRPSLILQRSVSSHSLQKGGTHRVLSSVAEFLDCADDTSPVRRVYSTGDLHERINMAAHHSYTYRSSESPLSSESNAIIEGMSKACRYSPEEKKERIERYRSKRNQRNFNKKIKYACRKTLADSRPRIRGRFARNEEIEKSSQIAQWSHINAGEDEFDEDDENWANFLEAFSSNLIP